MRYYKDPRGHINCSSIKAKLLYCKRCDRLVPKSLCIKMRKGSYGRYYKVKSRLVQNKLIEKI